MNKKENVIENGIHFTVHNILVHRVSSVYSSKFQ